RSYFHQRVQSARRGVGVRVRHPHQPDQSDQAVPVLGRPAGGLGQGDERLQLHRCAERRGRLCRRAVQADAGQPLRDAEFVADGAQYPPGGALHVLVKRDPKVRTAPENSPFLFLDRTADAGKSRAGGYATPGSPESPISPRCASTASIWYRSSDMRPSVRALWSTVPYTWQNAPACEAIQRAVMLASRSWCRLPKAKRRANPQRRGVTVPSSSITRGETISPR